MSLTYATWNPSDKGAGVTLSGGNLIATSAGYDSVRSTISKSTGKWYWELLVTSATPDHLIGVGSSAAPLTAGPGEDTNAYAYFKTGQRYHNATLTAYGASYTTNDVIGVALDADAGTVVFYKNNVSQGSITLTSVSTPYFAMFGDGTGSSTVTANFGATALTYSPPSGFNTGLYSGTASNSNFFAFM